MKGQDKLILPLPKSILSIWTKSVCPFTTPYTDTTIKYSKSLQTLCYQSVCAAAFRQKPQTIQACRALSMSCRSCHTHHSASQSAVAACIFSWEPLCKYAEPGFMKLSFFFFTQFWKEGRKIIKTLSLSHPFIILTFCLFFFKSLETRVKVSSQPQVQCLIELFQCLIIICPHHKTSISQSVIINLYCLAKAAGCIGHTWSTCWAGRVRKHGNCLHKADLRLGVLLAFLEGKKKGDQFNTNKLTSNYKTKTSDYFIDIFPPSSLWVQTIFCVGEKSRSYYA